MNAEALVRLAWISLLKLIPMTMVWFITFLCVLHEAVTKSDDSGIEDVMDHWHNRRWEK